MIVTRNAMPINGNSLEPAPREKEIQNLKAAVYDCHRQIQFLSQVQLPELERQLAQLENNEALESESLSE